MRKLLAVVGMIAALTLAVTACHGVTNGAHPNPTAVYDASFAASTPVPLKECFGHNGVQFGTSDAYLCSVKLGDDPSGALYFTVSLGDVPTGENGVWYKLHPAPGNFWVYETFLPRHGPNTTYRRSNGRLIQIDEGMNGQCVVNLTLWIDKATSCTPITLGGVVGVSHPFTPAEKASWDEFAKVMRAEIPVYYR